MLSFGCTTVNSPSFGRWVVSYFVAAIHVMFLRGRGIELCTFKDVMYSIEEVNRLPIEFRYVYILDGCCQANTTTLALIDTLSNTKVRTALMQSNTIALVK